MLNVKSNQTVYVCVFSGSFDLFCPVAQRSLYTISIAMALWGLGTMMDYPGDTKRCGKQPSVCVCVSVCSPSVQWPLNGGNSYLCWFGSMEVVLDRWIGMIQARFQWDAGGWPLPLEMSPVNYPPWYQKAGNFWCFGRSMVDVCLRRNLPVFQRSCCTAAVHRTSITTPTLCWQQKAIVRLMRRHWNMWWLMTNLLSGWWMVACQVYSMNSPWSMIFRK